MLGSRFSRILRQTRCFLILILSKGSRNRFQELNREFIVRGEFASIQRRESSTREELKQNQNQNSEPVLNLPPREVGIKWPMTREPGHRLLSHVTVTTLRRAREPSSCFHGLWDGQSYKITLGPWNKAGNLSFLFCSSLSEKCFHCSLGYL